MSLNLIQSMIELRGNPALTCRDGLTRRAMLRIGGLAPFGLSLPSLLAAKKRVNMEGLSARPSAAFSYTCGEVPVISIFSI